MKTPTIMDMLDELNLPKEVLSKSAGMDTGFGTHQFSSAEIPSGGFTLWDIQEKPYSWLNHEKQKLYLSISPPPLNTVLNLPYQLFQGILSLRENMWFLSKKYTWH